MNAVVYDFQDGNGPVPAHQHPNGKGWVANTATVEDTTYVGPDARVSGNAQVGGSACVSGNAQVGGSACVSGNAWVGGYALVYGYAWVVGGWVLKRTTINGYLPHNGEPQIKRYVFNSRQEAVDCKAKYKHLDTVKLCRLVRKK